MLLLFFGPQSRMMDAVALSLIGYAIGGLVVFLAGLTACDLMPKNAVGAVKGFIGLFSYMAASAQELISSQLITITEIVNDAGEVVKVYDFGNAQYFWLSTAVLSVFLALTVWNAKKVTDIDTPSSIDNELILEK